MAYETIPDSLIEVGQPTKRDLFRRVKDDLDDLNNRVASVEGSTAKIFVFNEVIKKPTEHKVGDIKFSFLSESEFQKQFDSTWILCDGRSVLGSTFQTLTGLTNAPDARGRFPRVKDHGAGVNPEELSLGTLQTDGLKSHTHTDSGHTHGTTESNHTHGLSNDSHSHPITDVQHSHTHNNPVHNHTLHDPGHAHAITDPGHHHQILPAFNNFSIWDVFVTGRGPLTGMTLFTEYAYTGITINANYSGVYIDATTTGIVIDNQWTGLSATDGNTTGGTIDGNTTGLSVNSGTANIQNTGITETRPKNITVNAFVKINESPFIMSALYKAAFDFTILGSVINNLIAGDAGDLEIDILKGTDLSSLVSIFSTKPKINYTAGNYANSSNAIIDDPDVVAGEWLRLDVVSFQHGQNKFHAYVQGEV